MSEHTTQANEQAIIASPSDENLRRLSALDKAREKKTLLKLRNENGFNPILKAKLNPKSKIMAIAAKCCDCVGTHENPGWMTEIRKCQVTSCPLYQFRPYK